VLVFVAGLAAAAGTLACATTVVAAEPAAGASSPIKVCAVVKAGGQSYGVSATHVACSFAEKWVAALAGKRLKNHTVSTALSKHPSGYECRAGTKTAGSSMQVNGDVQVAGNCAKGLGLGSSPYFNWRIQNVFG
jgi:hypothetical protein